MRRFLIALAVVAVGGFLARAVVAQTSPVKIGVVVMHGKGGAPTRHVSELAVALESAGFLVRNMEMPWSGKREYDVNVAAAVQEVEAALAALRDAGAQKVFVAGHSQGGVFALYFGGGHAVDGIIAIAPGGDVANAYYRARVAEPLAEARKLVAEGRGAERTKLADFEGAKGTFAITVSPAAYVTWFDPDGAMNQAAAVRKMQSAVPVLYIAPTKDYPALMRLKNQMFDALPRHPRTKLFEPDATHLYAPTASIQEIIAWTTGVANAR
ncbi:MAG: alpha/beta fold hydrolase [Burkholderiales bacterium]